MTDATLLEQHLKLSMAVEDLESKREFFQSNLGEEVLARLNHEIDRRVEEIIHDLETVSKSELDRQQGKISGLKEARLLVNGTAWEEEIEKARAELLAFENDNALLLQGQEAEAATEN